MGKWTMPPTGGHMEKPSKIYYQTMTKKDVEERLKVNDILLIPFASTENVWWAPSRFPVGKLTFPCPMASSTSSIPIPREASAVGSTWIRTAYF